jgi:nicotinate-nucleotide adenylyltransferase
VNRDAEYTEILRERLTERRFNHSLNVAKSAKELAGIYGYDEDKAYTAGLIHDCCKDTPAGLQLSYMLENKMALTDMEISTAKLYHAMCGSMFIQKEFGIDDEEIINAVRYHTTGRKSMIFIKICTKVQIFLRCILYNTHIFTTKLVAFCYVSYTATHSFFLYGKERFP